MKRTVKDLFKGKGLSQEEEAFLVLHILGGWTQRDAYLFSHRSRATSGAAALASNLIHSHRVKGMAELLVDFALNNQLTIHNKYNK